MENDLKLRRRIAKLTGNCQVVEDLMQDLFVKVYRNRSTLSGVGVEHYLMRSASNIARDYLRKLKHEKLVVRDSFQNHDNPEDLLMLNERLEFYESQVKPRLEALPNYQKEALLAYTNGNNLAREARKLGVPYSTVRSRCNAGLDELRKEVLKDKPSL
ncbi:RNA polymerase sigma factor [Acidobacteria bacterium AH-259-D05]|nr:RNA polymerase sigma factor [Acidobacteria bacterium AH-259-D05]